MKKPCVSIMVLWLVAGTAMAQGNFFALARREVGSSSLSAEQKDALNQILDGLEGSMLDLPAVPFATLLHTFIDGFRKDLLTAGVSEQVVAQKREQLTRAAAATVQFQSGFKTNSFGVAGTFRPFPPDDECSARLTVEAALHLQDLGRWPARTLAFVILEVFAIPPGGIVTEWKVTPAPPGSVVLETTEAPFQGEFLTRATFVAFKPGTYWVTAIYQADGGKQCQGILEIVVRD